MKHDLDRQVHAVMRMRNESDHRLLENAGKEWNRIKKQAVRTWLSWTQIIGPAFERARSEAMDVAGTNQPQGRGYVEAMSSILAKYRLDDINKDTRKALFDIMAHLDEVEQWRRLQPNGERLNHPMSVWQKFKRTSAQVDRKTTEKVQKGRSIAQELAAALEENEQLKARIVELEEELSTLKEAAGDSNHSAPAELA